MLKLASFVLFVSDIEASRAFYVGLMDQEVSMEIDRINVGFKSGLALWDKRYANEVIFDRASRHPDDNANLEVYFETADLDASYAKIQAGKVNTIHPIRIQPWQQRVFRVYDPDRFIVEIAETMSEVVKRLKSVNLSVEAIAQKTFMPIEAIRELLGQETE